MVGDTEEVLCIIKTCLGLQHRSDHKTKRSTPLRGVHLQEKFVEVFLIMLCTVVLCRTILIPFILFYFTEEHIKFASTRLSQLPVLYLSIYTHRSQFTEENYVQQ